MFLTALAIQLPVLIALLIGIIQYLTSWKHHPIPSLLAFLGLLLLMILVVINALTDYLPFFLQSSFDMQYSSMAPIQLGAGIIINILHAAGYILLLQHYFPVENHKLLIVLPRCERDVN